MVCQTLSVNSCCLHPMITSLVGTSAPNKILSPPPPQKSPQTPSQPLATPPALGRTPPPSGIFNKNRSLPLPGASDSPFPSPRAEKKKYPKRPPSKTCFRNCKGLHEGLTSLSAKPFRFPPNSRHKKCNV